MKANPDKSHFICSTDDRVNIVAKNQEIYNSPCDKLLGVTLTQNLRLRLTLMAFAKKHTLS